jgi:hypothetical protein
MAIRALFSLKKNADTLEDSVNCLEGFNSFDLVAWGRCGCLALSRHLLYSALPAVAYDCLGKHLELLSVVPEHCEETILRWQFDNGTRAVLSQDMIANFVLEMKGKWKTRVEIRFSYLCAAQILALGHGIGLTKGFYRVLSGLLLKNLLNPNDTRQKRKGAKRAMYLSMTSALSEIGTCSSSRIWRS